jgi:hypothetical protein
MPEPQSHTKQLKSGQAMQRLRDSAQHAGFACLDDAWHGWEKRYQFQCQHGHVCTRLAASVIHGSIVCGECASLQALERLHLAAQERGGQCLESSYLNEVPHRFMCAHGHTWKTRPSRILGEQTWCPQCARIEKGKRALQKDGLERLQRIAKAYGGACLSEKYAGGRASYQFVCKQGHQWATKGDKIVSGSWCAICANENKRGAYFVPDGLERLQHAAHDKGGTCLSDRFEGAAATYRFRCQLGHEWETKSQKILLGSWCPKCAHEEMRLGIEAMHKMAEEKGGRCLSPTYTNAGTKLHWECHRGHQWHAIPNSIRKGHWCPECAHMNQITNRNSKARIKYQATLSSNIQQ